MKLPAALLVASFALNGVLLTALFWRKAATDDRTAILPAVDAARAVSPAEVASLPAAALRVALQATDLPRDTIDALVLARIFSRYDARRREHITETTKLPWWRAALTFTTGTRETLLTPAQRKELRDLEAGARDEALRLLGPGALDPDGAIARRHAFVAPDKAVLLDALLRDYQNLGAELKEETGGLRTAADRAREKFVETEKQGDLAAMLTPEERERFELRTSPVVAVDEAGTEAAAATAAVMVLGGVGLKAHEIRVNRPFLFAVQHRATGTALFLGRIVDPR